MTKINPKTLLGSMALAVSIASTQPTHAADADFWKTPVGTAIQRGEDADGECAGKVLEGTE